MMSKSRYQSVSELKDAVIQCSRCSLRGGCSQVVAGEGNDSARVMFVGEAPGADEDKQGRPFVGRSGKLLRKIIENAGFDIDKDVYITNTNKCRPPNNRDPLPEEVDACKPWLWTEIILLKPKIIFTVGKVPTRTLFAIKKKTFKIGDYVGEFYKMPWPDDKFDGLVMPCYHPAYLLRNSSKIEQQTKFLADGYKYLSSNNGKNHFKIL